MSTFTNRCLLMLAVATAAACTVSDVQPPSLTGPSEMALRIALQAVPDSILQDGFSQAVINIDATGADGRAVRGLVLRVEITANGVVQDFGTVSAKTVVTGDDGRARVIYTAPPRPAEPVERNTVITLLVTPIGNDYRGESPRQVDIRLVTPGVIQPPTDPPRPPAEGPAIRVTPQSPQLATQVVFDATGVRCDPLLTCTFSWDLGDGTLATGRVVAHQYRSVGNFLVKLTVTDSLGRSVVFTQPVTVTPGVAPTVSFTFSPTTPAINETVLFNASAASAAPGRRIVSYDWSFGNGRTGTGVTTSTSYGAVGTYTVTLTVTDDAGQKTTATQTVVVSATGAMTAALTVSPTGGNTTTNFFFDASASRPGPSPIVEYRFTFGDNSPEVVGTSPTASHRYLVPGTYTARVTVRDSANRTATATASVTVAQ